MSPFIAELIGTMILILLGNGVVANVVLKGTKGNGSGWIVITTGWALAVFAGVVIAGPTVAPISTLQSHWVWQLQENLRGRRFLVSLLHNYLVQCSEQHLPGSCIKIILLPQKSPY